MATYKGQQVAVTATVGRALLGDTTVCHTLRNAGPAAVFYRSGTALNTDMTGNAAALRTALCSELMPGETVTVCNVSTIDVVCATGLTATLDILAGEITGTNPSPESYDSGSVTINDASNYVAVGAVVPVNGRSAAFHGVVGAAAQILHFKITGAATTGGTHTTLYEDTDLNSPTCPNAEILRATPNIYTTAGNGTFKISWTGKMAELAFYAKKNATNTTLRITGSIFGS